jgi:hypothetical protein
MNNFKLRTFSKSSLNYLNLGRLPNKDEEREREKERVRERERERERDGAF